VCISHKGQESAMVTMLIDTWQCIDGVFLYICEWPEGDIPGNN
jgi:hypothetical protein